jgi:hypothetical protein
MPEPALRALVGVELRRMALFAKGLSGALVAVGVFFTLLEGVTAGAAVSLFGVAAIAIGLSPSLNVMRDKLDGTLAFLSSLPVEPGVVITARLVSCTLGAALSGLLAAAGAALSAPGLPAFLDPGGVVVSVGAGVFLLTTLLSHTLLAVLLYFDAAQYPRLPLFALAGLLAAGAVVDRLVPDLEARLLELASHSHIGVVAVTGLAVVSLPWAWLCQRVGAAGVRRFRPRPDLLLG